MEGIKQKITEIVATKAREYASERFEQPQESDVRMIENAMLIGATVALEHAMGIFS